RHFSRRARSPRGRARPCARRPAVACLPRSRARDVLVPRLGALRPRPMVPAAPRFHLSCRAAERPHSCAVRRTDCVRDSPIPSFAVHMDGRRYVLISPCRDEAAFMRRTLDSVAAQSIAPALWVVVDDGSTDDTPRILDEYEARLPYLRVVRRTDRGKRAVGPGVIEAFYRGLATLDLDDFDYVCKFDMDLEVPPRYFELLMQRMESE